MRSDKNVDFFLLGGGKRAFPKITQSIKRPVYFSSEYEAYAKFFRERGPKGLVVRPRI